MLPTIQIFNRTISMYGLMGVVAGFTGVSAAMLRRNIYKLSKDDVLFASCYAGIGLLIGAKLLYFITIIPNIIKHRAVLFSSLDILIPYLSGGFVFYGGLIGAIAGFGIYCRQYKINLMNMLDLMAPSIPLIHGFGRIGCHFAGCCYGIPYHGPFHILLTHSQISPNNIPLLPIQLIESGFNFMAALWLFIFARKIRQPGKILGAYLIYYSITRFILEFFRGDIQRGIILGISTSQLISFIILPIGILLYLGFFEKINLSNKI